jgi:multisubunit Na+/H+ antiporter MnhF subunit
MPSAKMVLWIVGLSLVSTVALERYRERGGTTPFAPRPATR